MSNFKVLAIICVFSIAISCSQQKRYISYKVKEGETMKDIAKKLDVKTKDLERLNPDLNSEPQSNSVIIIPNPEYDKTALPKMVKTPKSEVDKLENEEKSIGEDDAIDTYEEADDVVKVITYDYTTHTVEAGETIYRLTKTYQISKEDLLNLNPEFPDLKDNKLSIGQVLKVEAIKKESFISRAEDLKNHVTYDVKSKGALADLARFYNVSQQQLLDLNLEYPNLKEEGLEKGQIIKIRPIEKKLDIDDVAMYIDTDSIAVDSIKVALLLPFRAKEYDTVASKDIFDRKNNRSAQLVNMVTDFYMGAEMAIDSLKGKGANINLKVFDTGNRGEYITSILENDDLDDVDAIIGPFYSDKAELVAKQADAPVIFPHFSKKQSEFSSSKIVKSSPDKETHSEYLVNYLKEAYDDEIVFVVGDGKEQSNKLVKLIEESLIKHDSIDSVHVLKTEKGYIKKERFTDKMIPKRHCWIILTSDDNVAVADALNSMVVLPEDVTAQVFAIDKNKAYKNININTLARIGFTYVSNTYVEETSKATAIFNRKYSKKNNAIPTEYAIKGFDITYDTLMRLASGEGLTTTYKEGASIRIEHKFDYRKKLFGSTANKGLFIVKYTDDLDLIRLK